MDTTTFAPLVGRKHDPQDADLSILGDGIYPLVGDDDTIIGWAEADGTEIMVPGYEDRPGYLISPDGAYAIPAYECAYCGIITLENDVPAVDDDERWSEISEVHEDDCEWVRTRAYMLCGLGQCIHHCRQS